MIDMLAEELITMSAATRRLPARSGGKRPHPATVYRWAKQGVRGVKLESIRCGGSLCTSAEALQRFCEALTDPVELTPAIVDPGFWTSR
jgi:hypothetical protein